METKKGRLGLNIPVITSDADGQDDLTVDAVSKWRAHLPLVDTGAAAKEIYRFVRDINTKPIETKLRFEILNIIRPPVQLICQNLKRHYIGHTGMLSKQGSTIANLAQTLQLDIAAGYKLVLEDMAANIKADKELAANCIYNILHYNVLIILRCYQLYGYVIDGVWLESHTLYKIAKENDLLGVKVGQNNNIDICYKHLMILAATNPYQWLQTEQEVINNSLDIWAKYSTLIEADSSYVDKPGMFVINTAKDRYPEPLGLYEDKLDGNCVLLDLRKEIDHIKQILNDFAKDEAKARSEHEGNPEYSIAIPTLQKLVHYWGVVPKRRAKRKETKTNVSISLGIANTHYYISGKQDFEPKAIAKQIEKHLGREEDEEGALNVDGDDDALSLSLGDSDETLNFDIADDLSVDDSSNSKEHPLYTCSTIDISDFGVALLWEENANILIQVGDVVVVNMKEGADNNSWRFGIIRWQKKTKEGFLRTGIEMFTSEVLAIAVRLCKTDGVGCFLRGFMMDKTNNFAATVITPTIPFKQGHTVHVYNSAADAATVAILNEQIEGTGSFRRFLYEKKKIKNKEAAKTSKAKKAQGSGKAKSGADDDEFSGIWDSL